MNQVLKKIQHLYPAVKPLWRSLQSVLAAILVGFALRSRKKCYFRRGWSRIGRRLVLVNGPAIGAGASQGANITHRLNPSSY